jgi:hypothetical protein
MAVVLVEDYWRFDRVESWAEVERVMGRDRDHLQNSRSCDGGGAKRLTRNGKSGLITGF